jgi:hypothetical protein
MINRVFCLSFLILFICSVSALTFDWGMKYGAGIGSVYGNELNYKLQYDFSTLTYDHSSSPLGHYINLSKHGSIGISQNLGFFFRFPIHQAVTNIYLQPELLWQHYNYRYEFDKSLPQISDSLLAGLFNHALSGEVETQIDYLTIPVLLMLHQNITRDMETNKTHIGVFSYFGPSFSVLINNKNTHNNGVADLDNSINDMISTSQNDADTLHSFTYKKISSATDELVAIKYGFVVGLGWNLKDLFLWGFGKDEWVLDIRFDFNINELGNSMTQKDFKLYSSIVSLGYKF